MSTSLLSLKNVQIALKIQKGQQPLVHGVSLELAKGEIVGLIGESGSGKSLTAKAIMGLLPSNMEVIQGSMMFKGADLLTLPFHKRRRLLGKEIGLIFQDYRGSFTPYIKIGRQLVEVIRAHTELSRKEATQLTHTVLADMGLDAERTYSSYPFQLSGGQVQRAAIAMAMALKPSLLICDEVTTALDLLNGERVLDYIDFVRQETGCAVLFITHDLAQAFKRTDRMYVMHEGLIVEEGQSIHLRKQQQHPYTKKLCASLLSLPKRSETELGRLIRGKQEDAKRHSVAEHMSEKENKNRTSEERVSVS